MFGWRMLLDDSCRLSLMGWVKGVRFRFPGLLLMNPRKRPDLPCPVIITPQLPNNVLFSFLSSPSGRQGTSTPLGKPLRRLRARGWTRGVARLPRAGTMDGMGGIVNGRPLCRPLSASMRMRRYRSFFASSATCRDDDDDEQTRTKRDALPTSPRDSLICPRNFDGDEQQIRHFPCPSPLRAVGRRRSDWRKVGRCSCDYVRRRASSPANITGWGRALLHRAVLLW